MCSQRAEFSVNGYFLIELSSMYSDADMFFKYLTDYCPYYFAFKRVEKGAMKVLVL